MENDNKTRQYVIERKIPENCYSLLYDCPNFRHFCNTLLPDKFSEKSLFFDETRLLIPFFGQNKEMIAFQGRALDDFAQPKYLTISFGVGKLFGLDRVDFLKQVLVLESPLDLLFLDNAIATAGGDLTTELGGYNKSNFVIVYDNEPRNKDTIKKMIKAVNHGYKVVVWPEMKGKDINEFVQNGCSKEQIHEIIEKHTFAGNAALLEISMYRKV